MKKIKKLISSLLAFTLVFGIAAFPATAYAADAPAVRWTAHPQSQTATEGERVTFKVHGFANWASGGDPGHGCSNLGTVDMCHISNNGFSLLYWEVRLNGASNWKVYKDENGERVQNSILNITATSEYHKAEFRLRVYHQWQSWGYGLISVNDNNAREFYSNPATLTVKLTPPKITQQPQNKMIFAGEGASFTVEATASGTLFYQWYVAGAAITDGGIYSGATTKKLSLSNSPPLGHSEYYCKVSNKKGRCDAVSVNSATAKLDVVVKLPTPIITQPAVSEAPAAPLGISGTTEMTLNTGYNAVSTDPYTVSGARAVVTKTAGNGAITWNNGAKTLNIAAGLPIGDYPVELTVSNGVDPSVTFTFTLTVEEAAVPPDINGTSGMTLALGYAAASTEPYTITGSPAPTVTKKSGNAAITWDDASKTLKIAAGLGKQTYPVTLKAANSAGEAEFEFTLTITDADAPDGTVDTNPAAPDGTDDTNPAADNTIKLRIDDPYMYVNGMKQEIDPGRGTKPIIRNNRTILPIRAIVEAMGGTVGWETSTRTVSLSANGHNVTMWLDKTNLVADGKNLTMDVAPVSINDRTMVPVRFAAENLGCEVNWEEATKEIVIKY